MNVFGSRAAPEVPTPEDASRTALAALGRLTGGLSPQALGGAWLNVLARLATSPGRQAELAQVSCASPSRSRSSRAVP
jgi:polyhydroxyalkanoate synthase